MILAAIFALLLTSALQAFNILLQIGAGTGLLFILRWFWWRINAMSEIVAMIVSFVIAVFMEVVVKDSLLSHQKLVIGVLITTIAWVTTALLTKPTADNVLIQFYKTIRPHSMGWKPVITKGIEHGAITTEHTKTGKLSTEILMMFFGCIGIYALLFGTGYLIYGQMINAAIAFVTAISVGLGLRKLWVNIE